MPVRVGLAHANSHEAHGIIVRWQHEDFEQGRIVNVSGWLLSETKPVYVRSLLLRGIFEKGMKPLLPQKAY
jgi:hypothetical protein